MAAGKHDILIEQGATFEQVFRLKDPTQLNFTQYTPRAQMRSDSLSTSILATFVCTVVSASELKIALTSAQTTALRTTGKTYKDTTRAYYDVELVKNSDSSVLRFVNGAALISPEVTK